MQVTKINVNRKCVEFMALMALCGIIVIIQSQYVGDLNIYSEQLLDSRQQLHEAILNNRPIKSTWQESGANGTNIRILSVYLAEFIQRYSPLNTSNAYKLLDVVSLFFVLVLLFVFLRRWHSKEYCLIAILFTGIVLPMTYALHFFHPWDRMGLLIWLLFFWAVREVRFLLAIPLIVLATLNKYDSVALPFLFFLAHFSSTNWRRTLWQTTVLFIVGFATYGALRWFIPGGVEPRDILQTVSRNVRMMAQMNVTYPPLLGFFLPVTLAAIGWRYSDQFCKASILFAAGLLCGPLFLLTNFAEIRSQMGALVLLMPAALMGLSVIVRGTKEIGCRRQPIS